MKISVGVSLKYYLERVSYQLLFQFVSQLLKRQSETEEVGSLKRAEARCCTIQEQGSKFIASSLADQMKVCSCDAVKIFFLEKNLFLKAFQLSLSTFCLLSSEKVPSILFLQPIFEQG